MLAGHPASTLAPFKWVLHAEACTILDRKPCDCVTTALHELHWLPAADRIQYKLYLLVHKSLLGHMTDYISDLLILASHGNLIVLRTCRQIGDRAFSVAAPWVLNRLLIKLKLLWSTDSFHREPKTFLFLFTSTRTRTDSVMCPGSSIKGCNTNVGLRLVSYLKTNYWGGNYSSVKILCACKTMNSFPCVTNLCFMNRLVSTCVPPVTIPTVSQPLIFRATSFSRKRQMTSIPSVCKSPVFYGRSHISARLLPLRRKPPGRQNIPYLTTGR